jgi:acetamidase/formamidase
VVSTRHGAGLLADEFPEGAPPDPEADARHWQGYRTNTTFCQVERRRGKLFGTFDTDNGKIRFPLEPFLGIMSVGVDVAGPVRSNSVGLHGGALDCRELVPGSRLFLPVQVPGALFAVGDPHYALGNGKVALTALEGPLRATFRLTTLREPAARAALGELREPFVETDMTWTLVGIDTDLTEALRRAARSAVLFLHTRLGLERADALAYLSAAADFGLCQVGDDVHVAFCQLRRADFSEPPSQKPARRGGFSRIVGSNGSTEPAPVRPSGAVPAEPSPAANADGASPGAPVTRQETQG